MCYGFVMSVFPVIDPVRWAYEEYKRRRCRNCGTPREGFDLTPLQWAVIRWALARDHATFNNTLILGNDTLFGLPVRIVKYG